MSTKPDLKPVPEDENTESTFEERVEAILTEKADEVFQKMFDRFLSKDVQKALSEKMRKEYEQLAVEDVIKTTTEILGQDYWEVMRISKWMRHEIPDDWHEVNEALMALGGYFTPVNIACAVLRNQLETKHSEIVTHYVEDLGYSVAASQHVGNVKCSPIKRNMLVMEHLRDAMIESINILKKLREDLVFEAQQVTHVQPDTAAGIQHMTKRPWMEK